MADITQDFNFLQGVKVVDFTQFEAGTTCTEVLAWFGAEVVKIENPGRGDPGRRLRPGKPDDDPWYFRQFNVNKKSIAINLKSPKGLEIVKELLKKADITAENMAPGTIERLGLDYESVKKINPRILYCRVKGFAGGSPHEKGLAFDMIAQAAGGPNDYLYITTSRANPEHWTRLMKLIGREDLIEDPRFATGDVRVQNSEELDGIIGEWTSKHDKRDAMEKLIAIGVPAGAVFDTMELQNEPTFEARGFMQHVKHHNGEDKMATWPVRVDGKSVRLKGAPALGQHTEEVLGGWLGLAAADIAALRNDGVF